MVGCVVVVTVNVIALLGTAATVTTTLPVVAPAGTGTEMLVAAQLEGVAVMPLNETELVPCDVPKLLPEIVITVPTGADDGLRLVMVGVVLPPPPLEACLNAANCAIHEPAGETEAVA